jgi:uncharacterized protein (TIGR02246 family)
MASLNETDALEEISRRRDRWIAAVNDGDPDGFVAVVADDAVWLPVGQPAIVGKEAIRDWLSAPFEAFIYDYSVTNIQVRLAGMWAVEYARFKTRAEKRVGGEAPTHEGIYTILWRYTEPAGWLIDRYIDHTGFDLSSGQ